MMVFQCNKAQVMAIFKYVIEIWNLIWFGVFLFFSTSIEGTINLMRQMQKDANSVLYQLEKS